jgi:hypothetical protein
MSTPARLGTVVFARSSECGAVPLAPLLEGTGRPAGDPPRGICGVGEATGSNQSEGFDKAVNDVIG